jgi:hypothetical protein
MRCRIERFRRQKGQLRPAQERVGVGAVPDQPFRYFPEAVADQLFALAPLVGCLAEEKLILSRPFVRSPIRLKPLMMNIEYECVAGTIE